MSEKAGENMTDNIPPGLWAVRFYIAGRYSRREELLGVRDVIQGLGGEVVSRWLDGGHQLSDHGVPIGDDGEALVEDGDGQRAAELRAKFARDDYEDVRGCDVLIAFTETPRTTTSRGGRHVELGLALALGKHIIVVGPRENVFCWLPEVDWYATWRVAARRVTGLAKRAKEPGHV